MVEQARSPQTITPDGEFASHRTVLGAVDGEFDLRFMNAVMRHDRGIILAAQEATQRAQRAELRQFAENLIQTQTQQIARMEQWRRSWYPQEAPAIGEEGVDFQRTIPPKTLAGQGTTGEQPEFDLQFLDTLMLYQGTVIALAQDALNRSRRPEIKRAAALILIRQETKMAQLRQWRSAWYQQ